MDDHQAVEQRIRSFIADYADWNRESYLAKDLDGAPSPCDFDPFAPDIAASFSSLRSAGDSDNLRDSFAALAREHFIDPECLLRQGMSISNISLHDPESELIVSLRVEGDRAEVETSCPGNLPCGWEYGLRKVGSTWMIDRIDGLMTDDEAPEPPDWSGLRYLTEIDSRDEAGLDFEAAFRPGGTSHNHDANRRESISVVTLGEIEVPSRVLVVREATEEPSEARPMEVRVASTRALVEVARLGSSNAFVRVWVDRRRRVAGYVPARLAQDDEESAAAHWQVDARCGGFVIADGEAWASLPARGAERFARLVWDDESRDAVLESARLLPLPDHARTRAALINRGGGDVSCSCYWGVDEHGKPVVLVIDCERSGESVEQRVEFPLSRGWFDRSDPIPQLTEFGFEVFLNWQSENTIRVSSRGKIPTLDLVDGRGAVLGSTERGGLTTCGKENEQRIKFDPASAHEPRLRLRWHEWRHGFARNEADPAEE